MSFRLGPHSRGRPNDSNESWNSGGLRPTAYPAQTAPFIVLERPTSCFLQAWDDVVVFRTQSAGQLPDPPPEPLKIPGNNLPASVQIRTTGMLEPGFQEGPALPWQVRFYRNVGVRLEAPRLSLTGLLPDEIVEFPASPSIALPVSWFRDPVTTISVTVDGQAQTVYQFYRGIPAEPAVLASPPEPSWLYPFVLPDPPQVPAEPAVPGPEVLTGAVIHLARVYSPFLKG